MLMQTPPRMVADGPADISARIERLPVTRRVFWTRNIIGAATFFDGYAIVQTITFSLYLYSAELYPTRLRAIGTGLGSAWLRLGSSAGPIVVGTIMGAAGIQYVFAAFAGILVVGALVTMLFAIETKGRVLEELSP